MLHNVLLVLFFSTLKMLFKKIFTFIIIFLNCVCVYVCVFLCEYMYISAGALRIQKKASDHLE